MKKILLCCAMGASSSIFEAKIKDYVKANNIDLEIIAKSVNDVKQLMKKGNYDCILLAPQTSYYKKDFMKKYADRNIMIEDISPADYGSMNGAKVVQDLMAKFEQ